MHNSIYPKWINRSSGLRSSQHQLIAASAVADLLIGPMHNGKIHPIAPGRFLFGYA